MKKTLVLFAALLAAGYVNAQPVPSNPKAIELSLSSPGPPYSWMLPQGAPGLMTVQVMNAGYGNPMPPGTFTINLSVDSTKIPFDINNPVLLTDMQGTGKWTIVNQSQSWVRLRNTNGPIAANEVAWLELKLKVPANAVPVPNATAALDVNVTGGMNNLASNTIATPQDDHMSASIPIIAASPLHVTLGGFSVMKQGNLALLEWSTLAEVNNDHFEIERSADASKFTHISSVAGAGNSESLRKYSITDDNTLAGTNYYRIKQVDKDGKSTYTEVRKVVFGQDAGLIVHPNPATDMITIDGLNGGEQLAIYNTMGRKIMETTVKGSPTSIEINALTPGNYNIVVFKDGQRISSKQFVKN